MVLDPATLSVTNVLVIAPHPDDESLGCGGLISSLAATRRTFHTLFMTDGGASHPGSRLWSRERLAACREREATDALASLGIGHHARTFLRLRDADMPAVASREWYAALARVALVLRTFHPDLVLLPWRRDPHRDHRDSWALVTEAISDVGMAPIQLEYTIWLEEFGQLDDYPRADEAEPVFIDITAALQSKRSAIAAHLTQTSDLIDDDPAAFRLSAATIARLTGPYETYWRGFR
jgi:LmbE family N-acetylglucosaminyl deacetylase